MIFSRNELVELSKEVAIVNEKWTHDPVTGERIDVSPVRCLMLIVSEIAEAMEGVRKNLTDTHLPNRKMEEVEMADTLIRLLDFANRFNLDLNHERAWKTYSPNPFTYKTKEENLFELVLCVDTIHQFIEYPEYASEELVFAITSVIQYCNDWTLDLKGAVREKMEYNKNREDHKIESRLAENGKKW